ncbi:acetate--CoA ligase family protein [Streptomyces chartreusis]
MTSPALGTSRPARAGNLQRLLAPRHIAVFGGRHAAEVIRQCRSVGYDGALWPVHPTRRTLEGLRCHPDVDALPEAPDAAFVGVPREPTVDVVAALARRGAGGAVCYASGFAESGDAGTELEQRLVAAAGDMAVVGPNCYGILNYLDGAALWPDRHGGARVTRGPAIITQSGNIGLNLTMHRRSLPLSYLIAVGNGAALRLHELVEGLLDDPRVTAVGLHIEGLEDVAGFSRAALKALRQGVPLVALKAGSSPLGARTALSHTSSLSGSDALYDALFRRVGVARVRDLPGLLETLKFLTVHGALQGTRIASMSCSGGEASLVADLAQPRGVTLPGFASRTAQRLRSLLGERVTVANPLDYHTYIWGDRTALTECYEAVLEADVDARLLVLDLPKPGTGATAAWDTAVDALIAAHRSARSATCLVSSLPEGLPQSTGARLLDEGIAPMQGLPECLDAIAAAAAIGAARARADHIQPLTAHPSPHTGTSRTLDEWQGKRALAARGLRIPEAALAAGPDEAALRAREIGFPVVLKAVSAALTHKTEAGAVRLDLADAGQVRQAAHDMLGHGLPGRFLVERMVRDQLAELIVGVHRDPQFGLALTVGAGGILVELLRDTATVLLPATPDEIRAALRSLRTWPLLDGYRGRPRADTEAVVEAVTAVAAYAREHAADLAELDVNPLLVLPEGRGVLAADVLIRLTRPAQEDQPHD